MVVHSPPEQTTSSEVIAAEVSLDDYMQHYAGDFYEWVEGYVVKTSPISLQHTAHSDYLSLLLRTYFTLKPIGRVIPAPFVMRLPAFPNRRREPDLQVILNGNPGTLTETYMDGAADICIEIVSPDSVERDHGEKFVEYEKGGVPEYWIVDAIHRECRFYRLNENGIYIRQSEDADGHYRTPALPGLRVHVPTLWGDPLPDPIATVQAVQAMLADENEG